VEDKHEGDLTVDKLDAYHAGAADALLLALAATDGWVNDSVRRAMLTIARVHIDAISDKAVADFIGLRWGEFNSSHAGDSDVPF